MFVIVNARYLFFDGKDHYTVEYMYAIRKWFVFREYGDRDAVMMKADLKKTVKDVTKLEAALILEEYLSAGF